MKERFLLRFGAGLTALAMVAALQPLAQAQSTTPAQPSTCQAFAQTGKQICGGFLIYWRNHGGLAQQGYPVSNEMKEASDVDGKTYTVQYFERAVFEYHPENKAPYDVLLSLLGSTFYKQRYPNGAPELPAPANPVASRVFPETGKMIQGVFRDYWEKHGGVMQQGYPISNELMEKSQVDGKEYRVQYFERAVFEYHPENQSPYNVLLSQLGTLRFKQKNAAGQPQPKPGAVQTGAWGGDHIVISVTSASATFDFDCAHGNTNGPLTADSSGRIDTNGVYVFEHGGPAMPGPQDTHPARYTGTTDGTAMSLTITLTDTGQTIGPFKAAYGQQGRIMKCM